MLIAVALLMSVNAQAGDWRDMPADAFISPMLFSCFVKDGFWGVRVVREAGVERLKIDLHQRADGDYARTKFISLSNALQGLRMRREAERTTYRATYAEQGGAKSKIVVDFYIAAGADGVGKLKFVWDRAGEVSEQECNRAPNPDGDWPKNPEVWK